MPKSLKDFEGTYPLFLDANIFLFHAFDSKAGDIQAALDIGLEFGLVMADAAHLAVMRRAKISHLASADSDFKVVSSITLWSP
jgi:predicted nucleic acid-binding protein